MDGSLALPDGRHLGYGEFGDPKATPLFYCHGFPTNRIEYELIAREAAAGGLDIRVIVLDRPGYGSSTFRPRRTFVDWPKDVAAAADHFGIDEFAVMGTSGGGPYAMACAAAMPDRVIRLGLVVAVGPADAPGMDTSLILSTVNRFSLVRRVQFGLTAIGLRKGQDEKIVEQTLANMSEVDRPFLQLADNRKWFVRMMGEALEQGGRPAAHEGGLYLKPWGFDITSITTETHLWYGGRDKTVPARAGEWIAEQIPGSDLVVWPEHGHFTWMASAEAADALATTAGTSAISTK